MIEKYIKISNSFYMSYEVEFFRCCRDPTPEGEGNRLPLSFGEGAGG